MNSFMKRLLLLAFLVAIFSACYNEKTNGDSSDAQQEYNAEELLREIEANPDNVGIVDPPWDTPPIAVDTPKVPDLREIGLEGFEGSIGLWITINVDGIVDSVRVLRSSGHPKLDSLVLDATRRTAFVPAKKNGKPIAVTFPVPISFVSDLTNQ